MRHWILLICGIILFAAGCTAPVDSTPESEPLPGEGAGGNYPAPQPGVPEEPGYPVRQGTDPVEGGGTGAAESGPVVGVPVQPGESSGYPAPVAQEFPEQYVEARATLAALLGVPEEQILFWYAEPYEFRDGCLELAQPGMMCTQALVPGYRLYLQAPTGIYLFHTNESGSQALLAREVPADGALPIVRWERSGGIAGTCLRLEIYPAGGYLLWECFNNLELAQGMLAGQDFLTVQGYRTDYGVTEWSVKLPAGAADMFQDGYLLQGQGVQVMPGETQLDLSQFLASLATAIKPADFTPTMGVLEVQASIGPVCPVVREGELCEDHPYQAQFEVQDGSGAVVSTFDTDAMGQALLFLPTGSYTLVPAAQGRLPFAQPQSFAIEGSKQVSLQVNFDSGIR